MVRDFEQYSAWRQGVVTALKNYQAWVDGAALIDAATEQRIERTLTRLAAK